MSFEGSVAIFDRTGKKMPRSNATLTPTFSKHAVLFEKRSLSVSDQTSVIQISDCDEERHPKPHFKTDLTRKTELIS